jgi:predicted aminopeptidase
VVYWSLEHVAGVPLKHGESKGAKVIGAAAALVAVLLASLQVSCASLDYVRQAAVGQNDLLVRARDIDVLLRDERVNGRMRRLLSQLPEMKRFGEAHGLTATTNYTKYVRVDRPVAVWVVSASAPLEFHSRSWRFPLVGSFTYLGWFKRDAADEFAAGLRNKGWDVDVRGAGAFSTNGYFEDPVVSTMIAPGPEALGELANVILHESAHATFFVRDQSTLNESVANFVGDTLGGAYLVATLGASAPETLAYEAHERYRAKIGEALRQAFVALEGLRRGEARSQARHPGAPGRPRARDAGNQQRHPDPVPHIQLGSEGAGGAARNLRGRLAQVHPGAEAAREALVRRAAGERRRKDRRSLDRDALRTVTAEARSA